MKHYGDISQATGRYLLFLILVLVFLAAFYWLFISSWISGPELNSRQRAYLNSKGSITVGIDKEYPPFEFISDKGEIKGLTIDYLRLMALKLGMEIRFLPGDWDTCIRRLKSGRVDMLNNVSPTPSRDKYMDYTESIFWHTSSIYVRKSNYTIQNLQDLEGKEVGVKKSSSVVRKLKHIKNIDLKYYDTSEELARALSDKKLSAVVDYDFPFQRITFNEDIHKFKRVGDYVDREKGTFAVQKDNQALLSILEKGIDSISESEMYRLQEKWFGKPLQVSEIQLYYEKYIFWFALASFVFLFILLWNFFLQWRIKRKTFELKRSELHYRTIFNSTNDAIILCDSENKNIIDVNQATTFLLGYTKHDLLNKNFHEFIQIDRILYDNVSHKNPSNEQQDQYISTLLQQGVVSNVVSEIKTAFGEKRSVLISSRLMDLENERYIVSILRDITDRVQAEKDLLESERKYKQERDYLENIFENSADAIIIVDSNGYFTRWNKRASELSGFSSEEMHGKHFSDVYIDRQEMSRMLDILRQNGTVRNFEVHFATKNGPSLPGSISTSLLHDESNKLIGSISIIRDLTEWKKTQKKLEEMSLYDSLTGLYNRTYFEEEMKRLNREGVCPLGVLVCDINGLKLINDTMGHDKGDELLRACANVLRRCFRDSDITARIGGDEFAVLLAGCSERTVCDCSDRIQRELEHYNAQDPKFGLSLSTGYAVAHAPPFDMNDLFKRADDAMYKEKLQQSYSSRSETAQALIKTLEARDYLTEGHAGRIQDWVQQLGQSMGLSAERLNDLRLLARFHDLGKVGIPDRILFKPGPLTPEEYQEMQRHCEIGHRIALSLSDLAPIADFILKHHEWWNGQGYPLGLSEQAIPLECRILAVVDAFDAMTSDRPYKEALPWRKALEELRRCAGTQFDPDLVERFIDLVEESEQALSIWSQERN